MFFHPQTIVKVSTFVCIVTAVVVCRMVLTMIHSVVYACGLYVGQYDSPCLLFITEVRLAEMSSMGIGNKPCLDIRPSADQINDRSITFAQLSKSKFDRVLNTLP